MAELIAWAGSEPGQAVDMFDKALDELKTKRLLVDRSTTR